MYNYKQVVLLLRITNENELSLIQFISFIIRYLFPIQIFKWILFVYGLKE